MSSPCIYDPFSPCEGCGDCRKSKHGFKDDVSECAECCDILTPDDTVYKYDDKHFCSPDCIVEYLKSNHKVEIVTIDTEGTACEQCGDEFEVGDTAYKFENMYFHEEDCLSEYMYEHSDRHKLFTAEDHEAEYGDMLYHSMKDDGLL